MGSRPKPKEKAKSMFDYWIPKVEAPSEKQQIENAKESAKKNVDWFLTGLDYLKIIDNGNFYDHESVFGYWEQVKEEIEKL